MNIHTFSEQNVLSTKKKVLKKIWALQNNFPFNKNVKDLMRNGNYNPKGYPLQNKTKWLISTYQP